MRIIHQTADDGCMVSPPPLPLPDPLPEPPIKPYPGFWHALGLFAVALGCMILLFVPVFIMDFIAKTNWMKNPWALGVVTLGGNLAAIQLGRHFLRISWRELAGPFRLPAALIPPMLSITAGQLLMTLLGILWLMRFFPGMTPNQTYGLDKTLLGAAFVLMIVAPLTEELLFRGVFLRGFVPRYGLAKGILLGAAMFAAAHMHPAKLFGTFLLGLIFGWWYTQLGSIWPGVIGHALNNSVPVLAVALMGKRSLNGNKIPPFTWGEPILALIAVALLTQGILSMRHYFAQMADDASVPADRNPPTER